VSCSGLHCSSVLKFVAVCCRVLFLCVAVCHSFGFIFSNDYIVFQCINTRQHTATRCNMLQHTATHTLTYANALSHIPSNIYKHCNTLQHTATRCNTLQQTHLHPQQPYPTYPTKLTNSLQHTATHCNTLQHTQHTATHCNKHTHSHSQEPYPTQQLPHTATYSLTLQHTATNPLTYATVLSHIPNNTYKKHPHTITLSNTHKHSQPSVLTYPNSPDKHTQYLTALFHVQKEKTYTCIISLSLG